MTSATAAAPVRLALVAILLASLAAIVVAGRADGAGRSWSAYLAPATACQGSNDASTSPARQRRSITCLVNWARVQDRRTRLSSSRSLDRAAALQGRRVASCGELSHTPCGSDLTAPMRAAGYRFSTFGENVFAGPWGSVTPRDVVGAWLRSPPHRANLLRPGFRDVGAALVRVRGLLGEGDAVVWVAAFAAPR